MLGIGKESSYAASRTQDTNTRLGEHVYEETPAWDLCSKAIRTRVVKNTREYYVRSDTGERGINCPRFLVG